MARYDFNAQRLFVEADLAEAATVACSADQANYLRNVLRLKAGDADPRLQRPRRRVAGASSPRPASAAPRFASARRSVRRRAAPTSTTCSRP